MDGEIDRAGPAVEVGGADGFVAGSGAADAHVRFGAEGAAVVLGDGVQRGEFVGVFDGQVAVGEAVDVDVEETGLGLLNELGRLLLRDLFVLGGGSGGGFEIVGGRGSHEFFDFGDADGAQNGEDLLNGFLWIIRVIGVVHIGD